MADCLWNLMFLVSIGISHGFLFDMSDGQRCPGVAMICPPMCRKYDAKGCMSCDCNNYNPAMPMDPSNSFANPANPSTNIGSGNYPANPLNGGGMPGSTSCNNNWQNCACAPSVDAGTGCLVCSCGHNNQQSSLQPVTNAPLTTPNQPMTTKQVALSTSGIISRSSSQPTSVKQTTNSITQTQRSTSTKPPNIVSSAQPIPSTTTVFNTKLPNIATTPAPSVVTSLPPTTTTQAAFVCPGIFNCSLDCYAGFEMDSNGCPKCQCAPVPTDLP